MITPNPTPSAEENIVNDYLITNHDEEVTITRNGKKETFTRDGLFHDVFTDSGNYSWGNGPWDFKMTFPNAHSETSIHSICIDVRNAPCEGHEAVVKITSGKPSSQKEQIFQGEFWPDQAFLLGKALLAFATKNGSSEELMLKGIVRQKEEFGFDSILPTGS